MDRLGKFFELVKNEYIKIYKKKSTRILLVIFLAVCICFAPMAKFINNIGMKEFGAAEFDEIAYRTEALQDRKREIENSPDMPLREEKLALIEAVDVDSDWEFSAYLNGMYDDANKQDIQTYTLLCKTNDWRGFCSYNSKKIDCSNRDKWVYKYKLEHDIGYGEEFEEKNALIFKIANAMDGSTEDTDSPEESIAKYRYQLENELYDETSKKDVSILEANYSEKFGFWDVMIKIPYVESFIGIIMLMIAGGIVASEFSQGTIKFLLISPAKRGEILMAKYVTVISMGFLLMLLMFLVNIPMVGMLFGFDGISAPYLALKEGEVVAQNTFIYLIKNFMLKSVQVLITTSLAFMISSLMRSTSLAIVTGFIVNSIGTPVIAVMSGYKMDWGRYLIFANTDLLTIYKGGASFPQQTVGFAIIVVVAHLAVFLLTAWDGFTRRSV
ncbi:ABC transporter permease [Ruminococcus albus]|uniref:ABC-2 type transport system permease protein n=1 Tax=Ruminococcus albus TaxID=1264 RepID=A0A1I1HKW5_RUMAL|nr:ABC transporter permease subunit [Ruminococcus albus]SFC24395.1 ABC-2 type transport system permease protein [Ruminococcus albus]